MRIRKKIFWRYQLPRLVGLGGGSTEKPLRSQSYGRKREKTPFLSLFEAESHLHELHTAPNTVWLHLMLRPQSRAARTSEGAASRAHTDPIWPRFEPDPHVQSPCISLYLDVSRRLGGPGAHWWPYRDQITVTAHTSTPPDVLGAHRDRLGVKTSV